MNQQTEMTMQVPDRPANEVFALTDEQILGIEAEGQEVGLNPWSRERANDGRGPSAAAATVAGSAPIDSAQSRRDDRARNDDGNAGENNRGKVAEGLTPEGVSYSGVPQEPPGWLAREMKDPWVGEEARELWEGVQRAQREAAAYREAFATPEDARALKEIYPGGVAEAKGAAERARELAEIDAVFFGAAGKPAEELRAGRTALVEKLYAQDPAAFREMVEAGVRILGSAPGGQRPLTGEREEIIRETRRREEKPAPSKPEGAAPGSTNGGGPGSVAEGLTPEGVSYRDGVASRYREFERATNAELEKSVGGAIARAMEAALPNLRQIGGEGQAPPLQERLRNAVKEEVESALRSDASLGEQVARVLSGRRFDEAARAQVVRLIDARAQQLVPGAVRRVVGSWTQATLGARKPETGAENTGRGSDERRVERAPSSSQRTASGNSGGDRNAQTTAARGVPRGRVDYRKMSDEQILGM